MPHVLVLRLEARFEPLFIHDLYSNHNGTGTHAAVERLGAFMRALNADGDQPGWFLQLAIRNCFNRIDQAILFSLINRRLGKAVRQGRLSPAAAWDLSWLTRVILKQDLRAQTVYCCSPAELHRVPEYKRITHAPPGQGLPIGKLTRQFFTSVYLNERDQVVKQQLKWRHYLRYVDDLILLDRDPAHLRDWRGAIARFRTDRLPWELKEGSPPRPVTDGADFLGSIVRPDYVLVRRRVVGNRRLKLAGCARDWVTATSLRLLPAAPEQLRAILASFLGHFAHADAWRLRQSLFAPPCWLGRLFDRQGRLGPRWEPPASPPCAVRSRICAIHFRRPWSWCRSVTGWRCSSRICAWRWPPVPGWRAGVASRSRPAAAWGLAGPGPWTPSKAWGGRCAPPAWPMPSSPRKVICAAE